MRLKTIVIIMAFTVAFITIDSSVFKFEAFGNNELSIKSNVTLFIIFSIIFSAISGILLRILKVEALKYSYIMVSICQYFIMTLLALIILQLVIFNRYSVVLLLMEMLIIHSTSLVTLFYLVKTLINWFRSNKNRIVILYAISFSLLSLNIIVSTVYLAYDFSLHIPYKRPNSIHMFLVTLPGAKLFLTFEPLLDILSFTSFVTGWITTTFLLSQYRHRIGNIKYWSLMSVPLIYFLFPFETYGLNITHTLMTENPVLTATLNVLIFSATKQVGGILFASVFLTAASLVKRPKLKNSIINSGIGIAILFGSVEIDSLVYAVYPPFGLMTIMLMPLGAFLLLNGLITSAGQMSRDAALRKEFYRSAENQLSLLRTIGLGQMENQLMKMSKNFSARFSTFEKSESEYEFEQQDIKQMVRDVLKELNSRKSLGL